MQVLSITLPITKPQLRRLHALWHEWAGRLELPPEKDRALRHYFVERFSAGRAASTTELTQSDAAQVIESLEKLLRWRNTTENIVAGTAGRHGFPERKRVRPNAPAWRALFACARALRMDREQLNAFVRRHYSASGLRSIEDISSMADLNRLLWGLKAILRRGSGPKRAAHPAEKKAA